MIRAGTPVPSSGVEPGAREQGRQALRVLLRLLVGFGTVPWILFSVYLFAHRIGSYLTLGGCYTAGGKGTLWALGEGLAAFVGIGASLAFSFDIWQADHENPGRRANQSLSVALVALLIWLPLMTIIPHVHQCA